ncbi:MAG: hypothetical protein ACHQFW_05535 [Chitinophagales bacterium]
MLINPVQAQKFLIAYNAGNYEKSLDLSKKTIDKDPKNLDAYLIKAMSYMHLATNEETKSDYYSGIETSISTLEFIILKDKKNIFLPPHQEEVDSLMSNAFIKAEDYFSNEKYKKSEALIDRLIKITPTPEYFFLKGQLLMVQENEDVAIAMYNNAASKIYIDSKSGKLPQPYLSEAFIELGNAIYEDGDDKAANIIFYRAAVLFNNDDVDDAYYNFIGWQAGRLNEYSEAKQYDSFLLNMDSADNVLNKKEKMSELKWEVIVKYYNAMVEQTNYQLADSVLTAYSCSENYQASIPLIYSKIIDNTRVVNSYEGTKVIAARNETQTLINLYNCLRNDVKGEMVLFDILDSLLVYEKYTESFKILYNASVIIKDKKKIAAVGDKIYQLLKNATDTINSSVDMYELTQYFPDNKNFKTLQQNTTIQQIGVLIDKNKFSEAGELLRRQLAINKNDATLKSLYKKWVIRDYVVNYRTGNDWIMNSATWNGSVDNCNPGKLSEEYQQKFLQRLNYVRRIAGVPDKCELRESWNVKCQAAALMMTAESSLSHGPGKDWACYSEAGATGAGNSNLSLGASGLYALMGQVDDDGSNNTAVGHRRWILNPYRKVFGHGSTNNAMAFWALGGENSNYTDEETKKFDDQYVVWPPEYFCPTDFYTARWSFSLSNAIFDETTVEMYHGKEKINCTVLEEKSGYGLSTLVFEPELNAITFSGEEIFTVILKNVKLYSYDYSISEGKTINKDYSYSTTFFRIEY